MSRLVPIEGHRVPQEERRPGPAGGTLNGTSRQVGPASRRVVSRKGGPVNRPGNGALYGRKLQIPFDLVSSGDRGRCAALLGRLGSLAGRYRQSGTVPGAVGEQANLSV